MERRDRQLLGQPGEGQNSCFSFCAAGPGPTSIQQEVERSAGLLGSPCVLRFLAGPSSRSRGHPFGERGGT